MKNKPQNQEPYEITNTELDLLLEEVGIPIWKRRSNEDWIKSLEARLAMQRKEFAALLDQAAEKPELLKFCREARQEMQTTRQRLADCYLLQARRN